MEAIRDMLTCKDAAAQIGLANQTLHNLTSLGTGPPAYKYRGRLYFRKPDLLRWVNSRITVRECQQPESPSPASDGQARSA